MFKLIIAGGRDFNDYSLAEAAFLKYISDNNIKKENIEIVSGAARGVDRIGEQIAENYELLCKKFPADWDVFGRSAGYRRNAEMAVYADGLLAFWDGISKGTSHMINLAKDKELLVEIVKY